MNRHTPQALRILLLEDDPLDAELVEHALLRSFPAATVLRVHTRPAFVRALEDFRPDVILSDHAVASFNACDTLRLVQARASECPVLLVAAAFERTVSQCLKAGAADFVRKADLALLGGAIREALDLREPLRRLSARQRQVLHLMVSGSSTRESARKLRLSIKTVEAHRSQVMKRLNIGDVAGLVRYAIRIGLISPG